MPVTLQGYRLLQIVAVRFDCSQCAAGMRPSVTKYPAKHLMYLKATVSTDFLKTTKMIIHSHSCSLEHAKLFHMYACQMSYGAGKFPNYSHPKATKTRRYGIVCVTGTSSCGADVVPASADIHRM